MNIFRRISLLLLLAAGLSVPAVSSAAPKGTLDGKTFAGEVGSRGETKGDSDNFIFKDGTFRSSACDEYGYTESAYKTSSATSEGMPFNVTTSNKSGDKIAWQGLIKGDSLRGTAVRTMPSGKTEEMWFSGTLKK